MFLPVHPSPFPNPRPTRPDAVYANAVSLTFSMTRPPCRRRSHCRVRRRTRCLSWSTLEEYPTVSLPCCVRLFPSATKLSQRAIDLPPPHLHCPQECPLPPRDCASESPRGLRCEVAQSRSSPMGVPRKGRRRTSHRPLPKAVKLTF